jgi:hypothetical protein
MGGFLGAHWGIIELGNCEGFWGPIGVSVNLGIVSVFGGPLGISELGNYIISSNLNDADRSKDGKSTEKLFAENKKEGNEKIGRFACGGGEL